MSGYSRYYNRKNCCICVGPTGSTGGTGSTGATGAAGLYPYECIERWNTHDIATDECQAYKSWAGWQDYNVSNSGTQQLNDISNLTINLYDCDASRNILLDTSGYLLNQYIISIPLFIYP